MRLDAADLATLEIDVENLEPLGRDVARMLLEHIRGIGDEVETANKRVELAIDDAKDALSILKQLRWILDSNQFSPADGKADDLEEAIGKIYAGRER